MKTLAVFNYAVFRFHFFSLSSWNFVGSKSNVNTPCRDVLVLFLDPHMGEFQLFMLECTPIPPTTDNAYPAKRIKDAHRRSLLSKLFSNTRRMQLRFTNANSRFSHARKASCCSTAWSSSTQGHNYPAPPLLTLLLSKLRGRCRSFSYHAHFN